MTLTPPQGNEIFGALPARLEELATCPETDFNAEHAINAIEEAVGGSLASDNHRAALNDFTSAQLDHLETVVNRFDKNPPVLNDNEDLELYTDLVGEAHMLIGVRRDQIQRETDLGGRNARIEFEMRGQRDRQQKLFLDTAHNTLNAAADLNRTQKRRTV